MVNLKCILLNKRSQSEKATHYDSNCMALRKGQNHGDGDRVGVARGSEGDRDIVTERKSF